MELMWVLRWSLLFLIPSKDCVVEGYCKFTYLFSGGKIFWICLSQSAAEARNLLKWSIPRLRPPSFCEAKSDPHVGCSHTPSQIQSVGTQDDFSPLALKRDFKSREELIALTDQWQPKEVSSWSNARKGLTTAETISYRYDWWRMLVELRAYLMEEPRHARFSSTRGLQWAVTWELTLRCGNVGITMLVDSIVW